MTTHLDDCCLDDRKGTTIYEVTTLSLTAATLTTYIILGTTEPRLTTNDGAKYGVVSIERIMQGTPACHVGLLEG